MADRAELLKNALAFLNDPSTRHHPLTQRVAFLESKGLTNAEIESVLAQSANSSASQSINPSSTAPIPYGASPYAAPSNYSVGAMHPPPAIPQRDWRDYFIMAVVSGGVMFGLVSLARKYLMPHLQPPSKTAYEADRDALTAQFDAAAALIESIQSESKATRTIVEEEREKVESALEKLETALEAAKDAENRARSELRGIREEVDNVRDMLPKMIEKNKAAQSQALLDLQQELKSLKSLLLSRPTPLASPGLGSFGSSAGPGAPSGAVSAGFASPTAGVPPIQSLAGSRPSIPAWQLGPSGPPAIPANVALPVTPSVEDKGKGKGKEIATEDPLASSGVLVGDGSESEASNA